MKIKQIKIRNFRTIKEETSIDIKDYMTIVGPNNSGKTNLLKAIHMFFTGFDNEFQYHRERDFSDGASKTLKTTINITFEKEPSNDLDNSIFTDYLSIFEYLDTEITKDEELTVYLTFNGDTPNYQLFSNVKKKNDKQTHFSIKQKAILNKIFNAFSVHYIPSEKSIQDLYFSLVTPFLAHEIGKSLKENSEFLTSIFTETSQKITSNLNDAGLINFKFDIQPPDNNYARMIKGFEFLLKDNITTNVFEKGMGIQTASLLSCFLWVTEREMSVNKSVVWLIEEPEAFLHPSLSDCHLKLLNKLRRIALVVNSTHSLQFVPQDPTKILGTTCLRSVTKIEKYKTFAEASNSLRSSLGIQFSHFFNLGLYNVFVEGPTDREYFKKIISYFDNEDKNKYTILNSTELKILDFGGTSNLEGFLKTTFEFIQKERAFITILDGDGAGIKTSKNLQGYIGKKNLNFVSNYDFLLLKKDFEIEGYFPENWIKMIHSEQSQWFDTFSLDVEDKIAEFSIVDTKKTLFQEKIFEFMEQSSKENWFDNFIVILNKIQEVLVNKHKKITSTL